MADNEQLNGQENENIQNNQERPKKKDSSAFGTLFLIIFLFLLLSIPIIFTRFNLFGAGESLRPILKTNSVFRNFLPPVKDPNDAAYMNREQLLALVNDLKGKVEASNTQLSESNRVSEIYTGAVDGFLKFDADKAQVEATKAQNQKERAQLEQDKVTFYNKVKNEDKPSFKEFYEKMDAKTAEKIYTQVMKEEKVSTQIKAFVEYYQKMDPSACAKIFEQISKTQVDLVAEILLNMDSGKASKVLEAMDSKVSAKITEVLANKLPIPKN